MELSFDLEWKIQKIKKKREKKRPTQFGNWKTLYWESTI
jgi:hypothetical protein